MSASMPPTRAATLRSSPGESPFSARSTLWIFMPRSLNQRSAFRVSLHFFVPKIWMIAPLTPASLARRALKDGAHTPLSSGYMPSRLLRALSGTAAPSAADELEASLDAVTELLRARARHAFGIGGEAPRTFADAY